MDNIYCPNCGDLVWCGDGIGYAPGPAAAEIERLREQLAEAHAMINNATEHIYRMHLIEEARRG